MIRYLMTAVGLCLSVAAFGCSSDGGSGGSGGSTGACTGSADVAVICDSSFSDAVATCGLDNLAGGAEAIASCVEMETGLSGDCSACFGETTQCSIDNCLQPCGADPLGDACTTCRAENCDPAFNACAGEFSCEGAGGNGGAAGNGGNGGAAGNGGVGGNGGAGGLGGGGGNG